ncbi:hypothetical protein [Kallotenue papyrolyticum]|uniref:hypothetical protein n=1 Tax=Kallotenue papyrolyticum TaxID=1325125 RepID=UPI0004785BAF|nr:hypothetical protein [Kallotenue papyrolyticum]
MMRAEWLLLTSGPYRLAVPMAQVRALQRRAPADGTRPLARALGATPAEDEACLLVAQTPVGEARFQVQEADVYGDLPHLPLPPLLQRLAHPSIAGVVLDGETPIPIVDLAHLVAQPGLNDT